MKITKETNVLESNSREIYNAIKKVFVENEETKRFKYTSKAETIHEFDCGDVFGLSSFIEFDDERNQISIVGKYPDEKCNRPRFIISKLGTEYRNALLNDILTYMEIDTIYFE